MDTKDWHTPITKEVAHNIHTVLDFCRENNVSTLYKDLPITSDSVENLLEEMKKIPTLTLEKLREHETNRVHYKEKDIRYLVSEFELENYDDLFLTAQHIDTEWETVSEEIDIYNPQVSIIAVPLSWQLGPMFYKTCRGKRVPVSVVSPRNPPLIVQLIKETDAQMIITTLNTLEKIIPILESEGLKNQIKIWHIIAPLNKKILLPQFDTDVSIEYHIFPGIPIGYIKPSRNNTRSGFCPNSEYFFEIINSTCYITSLRTHAIPLIRFKVSENASIDSGGLITFKEYE